MKLSVEQIRSVCMGVTRIEETDKGVRLLRFTKEQEEIYRMTNADFTGKHLQQPESDFPLRRTVHSYL